MNKNGFPQKKFPPEATALLEIDLGCIRNNYRILHQLSKKSCGAVVKADAYGMGMGPVSKVLFNEGCRHFFVTNINEGIELRKKHFLSNDANIYVFNGTLKNTEELFIQNQLTPILISMEQLKQWSNYAKLKKRKLPAVIHIDTGMYRTGLSRTEQQLLLKQRCLMDSFDVHFIMSHLSCANQPSRPENMMQLVRFKQFAKFFPHYCYSLATSIGIPLGTEYHFDLTRAGFGLYGSTSLLPECQLCAQLWTRIIQIQSVPKGSMIGYGCKYHAPHQMRIAVLNIGFADLWACPKDEKIGLSLHGQRIPLVSRISMDLITADITSININRAKVGDWVQLLGPQVPLSEAASISNTTPAKILTNLRKWSHHRVYYDE